MEPKQLSFEEEGELRRIKLVNVISIISLVTDIIYILFYMLLDFENLKEPIIILIASLFVFPVPIILNRIKLHSLAKLMIASINSIITIWFCIVYWGSEPGIQVFLLIFGLIPFFIWSYKQVVYSIIFFGTNLMFFIYIEFFLPEYGESGSFPIDYIDLARGFSVLLSFLGASAAIIAFHKLALDREKQLKSKNEKLAHSNSVRSKIFSVIGHDIKSPINSIRNLIGEIIENCDEITHSQMLEYLRALNQTSDRTLDLLNNLLDWSKMHSDRLNVNTERLNLLNTTQSAIEICNEMIKKKNIKLIIDIDKQIFIRADKHMIQTVIRNLTVNAVKFTQRSGVVEISAQNLANNEISVSVTDNGIGMTKEEIDRLFKLENGLLKLGTEEELGSGLGLIICKEFIERNNGILSIESSRKSGSKFSFTVESA